MAAHIDFSFCGWQDSTGTGHLHMYPHRYAHPKTRWVEDYKIDLSTRETALIDYYRIVNRKK